MQLHEVIPMHWLIAAMLSTNSAVDLRGLRPRDSQSARWSAEYARLQRGDEAATPLRARREPRWKFRRLALRSWLP
jgi:hypothetical protein